MIDSVRLMMAIRLRHVTRLIIRPLLVLYQEIPMFAIINTARSMMGRGKLQGLLCLEKRDGYDKFG